MFLLRPVKPDTFFRDGLPVVNGSENYTPPVGKLLAWYGMYCNDLGIINQHFDKKKAVKKNRRKYISKAYGLKSNVRTLLLENLFRNRFSGFEFSHAAAAYRRRSFESLWAAEPELLNQTTANKFRSCFDLNQWAVLWWQIASGEFAPGKVDNALYAANTWMTNTICDTIVHQKHDMICINDPDNNTDFEVVSKTIQDAFNMILPDRCSFEK